jgi:hypothetical protein
MSTKRLRKLPQWLVKRLLVSDRHFDEFSPKKDFLKELKGKARKDCKPLAERISEHIEEAIQKTSAAAGRPFICTGKAEKASATKQLIAALKKKFAKDLRALSA